MLSAATLPGIANLSAAGSAQFSPDGDTIAAGTGSGSIRLWNAATRQPLGPPIPAAGSFVFSPDGKTLAIGPASGPVRVWDIAARRWVGARIPSSGAPAAFSPDGSILAAASQASVQLWNVRTGKLMTAIGIGDEYGEYSVAFSPAGNLLAIGFANNEAGLWDVGCGYRPVGRRRPRRHHRLSRHVPAGGGGGGVQPRRADPGHWLRAWRRQPRRRRRHAEAVRRRDPGTDRWSQHQR
ncbi:MAG TPA: hypothetical protein VN969_07575 [Streptosporangiaceae bacterium]|nr:hypothetical protein [Streptosporangiaceae bacterium]